MVQLCWKDNSPDFVDAGVRSQIEEQPEGAIAHDDIHNEDAHVTCKGPKLSLEGQARDQVIVECYPLVEETAQRIERDGPTLMQDSGGLTADGDNGEAGDANEVRTHVSADVRRAGEIAYVSCNDQPSDSTDNSWAMTTGFAVAGHSTCIVCVASQIWDTLWLPAQPCEHP